MLKLGKVADISVITVTFTGNTKLFKIKSCIVIFLFKLRKHFLRVHNYEIYIYRFFFYFLKTKLCNTLFLKCGNYEISIQKTMTRGSLLLKILFD